MEEALDLDLEDYDLDDEPANKRFQANRWKLWHLYNDLDHCKPARVKTLRTAIAYLGGSLEYRYPVPKAIARTGVPYIPVRQPTPKPIRRRSQQLVLLSP